MITAKEIRNKTGLTQSEFAKKYGIPLTTYKSWECNPNSTSYRKCPDYCLSMLNRVVEIDFNKKTKKAKQEIV